MRTVEGNLLPEWPVPTRNGYVFDSWWSSASGTGTAADNRYSPSSPIVSGLVVTSYTIYARWIWPDDAPTYTVTFHEDEFTILSDGAAKSGVTGEGYKLTIEPPTPLTRNDGYHFVAWYTAETGGEEVVRATTEFEENATIYARWSIELADDEFMDERDGKIYKWTQIGTQKWMAQNLNYDGSDKNGEIEIGTCYTSTASPNAKDNCDTYGRLYSWAETVEACPAKYHLPTVAEWTTLTDYYSGSTGAAIALSAVGFITNATNSSGFSALPGGYVNGSGTPTNIGSRGRWWTATELETNADNAWFSEIFNNSNPLNSNSISKASKYSVRCIED
jgi:uncharacterized protein (TIGR02145 family)/uncharacterized repeat protein (TIGR02543 family)